MITFVQAINGKAHGARGELEDKPENYIKPKDFAYRCRHFSNDRPCLFHKENGVDCTSCPHKDLVDHRVLVIKLDSPGDVLRTTCLLPSLKRSYPSSQITWITRKVSRPILENNPHIDRIVDQWDEMFAILQTENFDTAINPDANPQSARLLRMSNATQKFGMTWSAAGHVHCCNQEAEKWLWMGLSDNLKRANRETYQVLVHRLCCLNLIDPRPLFYLTDREKHFAKRHLKSLGVNWRSPVIGMNTGAGLRWAQKSWTLEKQIRLIRLAKQKHPKWQILLMGGPEEEERNHKLEEICPNLVINTGHHPVRIFAALVELTQLLLTADTLALHVGLALNRQIIALFGPTSAVEIDLCGSGEKLFADLDCLCCYRTYCDRSPSCMDLLTPERVLSAIEDRLEKITLI